MTAAPTLESRSTSSQAATNWAASSLFRAFLVAGAFRVMNATPSAISRSIIGSVSRLFWARLLWWRLVVAGAGRREWLRWLPWSLGAAMVAGCCHGRWVLPWSLGAAMVAGAAAGVAVEAAGIA